LRTGKITTSILFDLLPSFSYTKRKMKLRKQIKKPDNIVLVILILLFLNVIALDVIVFRSIKNNNEVLGTTTIDACPQACITRINQISGKTTTSTTKEYYVPLGTGTNTTDEWTDVSGASAYINTASYSKIKQAMFEATVAIPSGSQRVWVRLFNATDKHPVWYSEMTTDGSAPQLLTSSAISLDPGNKLYQVQMKTQLKILTNLTQSRVKIITY